ncbi:MAG: ABC transporter ATP-binding protein [Acidobacteria bacterium]|nr:ABC transporter ATP-binding protein [Acidobacteriota bacterium]
MNEAAREGPVLAVEGLVAGYGRLVVLHGISLRVPKGEVVALMGSNGAGKTTTMKAIVGLLKPFRGKVLFEDAEVTRLSPEALVARGLALVPEGRGMLRELTVRQNLELGGWVVGRDRARIGRAMERAFSTFPVLGDRQAQLAGTLSGGEQQMLALARALMSEPKMLLVDEASMGLSPSMTEVAFDLIRRVNAELGISVLLVEQNVLALELAHRVYVLEKGEIKAEAGPSEVRDMSARLREAYLGTGGGGRA